MKNIKVLDCTLRDGGFVNNWNFGKNAIYNIVNRLSSANVDIIELGFLNDSYPFDVDKTILPHSKYLSQIFKLNTTNKPKLVAMVIMGECSIDSIGDKTQTPIDGIRVVFKKNKIKEAFDFAEKLRHKGYEVFLQPASVTDYSDEDMLNLVELTNNFKPTALYIVDTYGLMHKDGVLRYFKLIDCNLSPEIALGYHSHNNFQLSYATSMDILEVDTDRTILIDSSLLGMGKGAGNLNTELIVDYLNKKFNKNYDLLQILETIDSEILKIKKEFNWGYTLDGFIAASNDCHPMYVSYLTSKKTLSVKSVNVILSNLKIETKTVFDKQHVESLYIEHQSNEIDDFNEIECLSEKFDKRNILLLAPGASLNEEFNTVSQFIEDYKPIVISINHYPEKYKVDFIFVNNVKRYGQMAEFIENNQNIEMIVTSNITYVNNKVPYHTLNYSNLVVEGDVDIVSTNATLMLLNLLIKLNSEKVFVAGFDGFTSNHNSNYVDRYLSYNTNLDFDRQNLIISETLNVFRKTIDVKLITKSYYES